MQLFMVGRPGSAGQTYLSVSVDEEHSVERGLHEHVLQLRAAALASLEHISLAEVRRLLGTPAQDRSVLAREHQPLASSDDCGGEERRTALEAPAEHARRRRRVHHLHAVRHQRAGDLRRSRAHTYSHHLATCARPRHHLGLCEPHHAALHVPVARWPRTCSSCPTFCFLTLPSAVQIHRESNTPSAQSEEKTRGACLRSGGRGRDRSP